MVGTTDAPMLDELAQRIAGKFWRDQRMDALLKQARSVVGDTLQVEVEQGYGEYPGRFIRAVLSAGSKSLAFELWTESGRIEWETHDSIRWMEHGIRKDSKPITYDLRWEFMWLANKYDYPPLTDSRWKLTPL